MKNKKRVIVAMSGGVDSSVAAYLLKKRGYEVIGVSMRFSTVGTGAAGRRKKTALCGTENIKDAKKVCQTLGIRHYTLNFAKNLKEKVIDDFCKEYLRGRTPNPCVRCNQFLKFDILLNKAKQMDAQFFATGHYVRIVYSRKLDRYLLKRGKDKQKDQSYFLYGIKKKNLPNILMPLGNYTKKQVRAIAKKAGLKVATKTASQEICFINTDYREFLKHRLPQMKVKMAAGIKPGSVINAEGEVLGEHQGICFYTLGQRGGLGIALGYRAYVIKIDAKKNTIVVGKEDQLYSSGLIAERINLIGMDFSKKPFFAKVKIRYNHKQVSCRIIPFNKKLLKIEFLKPQRAVTPGQSVVFYDRDVLLGGGIIQKSLL